MPNNLSLYRRTVHYFENVYRFSRSLELKSSRYFESWKILRCNSKTDDRLAEVVHGFRSMNLAVARSVSFHESSIRGFTLKTLSKCNNLNVRAH